MSQFITIFRPHQRPAWAQVFNSEADFTDAWIGGRFKTSCNAHGPEDFFSFGDCDFYFDDVDRAKTVGAEVCVRAADGMEHMLSHAEYAALKSAARSARHRNYSYHAAVDDVAHDLYALTRIDSQEELHDYVAGGRCHTPHNRGIGAAIEAGKELGWWPEAESEA